MRIANGRYRNKPRNLAARVLNGPGGRAQGDPALLPKIHHTAIPSRRVWDSIFFLA
jgi:hypothetical protein